VLIFEIDINIFWLLIYVGLLPMPRISVIVTAFNRKEYVHEAINSVLNQSLEPSEFEIILISNFEVNTKNFHTDVPIRSLVMNGTVGEFLYQGISMARNEIIAFLDDDDVWHKDRLKEIVRVFSLYGDLAYYHNSPWYIDSGGNTIYPFFQNPSRFKGESYIVGKKNRNELSKLITLGASFNLSSIAISKPYLIFSMEALKHIVTNPDGFLFWASVMSGGKIYIDKRKFTGYRMHNQSVTSSTDRSKQGSELLREMKTYELLLALVEESVQGKSKTLLQSYIRQQYMKLKAHYLMVSGGGRKALFACIKGIMKISNLHLDFDAIRIFLYSLAYAIHPRLFSFVENKVSIIGYYRA